MERFNDRNAAGRVLAELLVPYSDRDDVVVLGLPRGGIPVACEVANNIRARLDVMVVRKIGAPGLPEFAIGAIATGGVVAINEDSAEQSFDTPEVRSAAIRAGIEMTQREMLYRNGQLPLVLKGRTIILVDDGMATGASMRAAIRSARRLGAFHVVIAVAVAAMEACQALRTEADEVVYAKIPRFFTCIGDWYHRFDPVSDAEVITSLTLARAHELHSV